MYCKKCGQEVNDEAVICIHCGCSINDEVKNNDYNQSKTGIGIIMALCLGLIGLIIGSCIYPSGTEARKTFVKAWCITFFISIAVYILIYLFMYASIISRIY